MGPNISARSRQLLYIFVGAAVAVTTAVAALAGAPQSAPRVLAGCNDIVDTTDSFSMNCVPTIIPDTSDQLTEAEVAEPGWNAGPAPAPGSGGHK